MSGKIRFTTEKKEPTENKDKKVKIIIKNSITQTCIEDKEKHLSNNNKLNNGKYINLFNCFFIYNYCQHGKRECPRR